MSLCILLRTPDGAAMMAADSAVSTVYEGTTYRVQNEEDHEKVITHLGYMIFCSGNLERCRVLRAFIRSLNKMDYKAIGQFAQKLWGDETDNSTGILVCAPDNSLIGMLSASKFEVAELPWNKNGLDIDTLGFRMQEAYQIACKTAKTAEDWRETILKAFTSVACEEVGGTLHVLSRQTGEDIKSMVVPLPERPVRRGVFVPLTDNVYAFHAVVQASQFLDKNGKDMFTQEGKISSQYLDLGNIVLDGTTGDITMTGNLNLSGLSNINFGKNKFVKTRYSIDKNAIIPDDWTEVWNSGWSSSTTTEVWAISSYDGGMTWDGPLLAQGKNGQNGTTPIATYSDVKSALNRASKAAMTIIDGQSVDTVDIYARNIYGGNIYAGEGSSTFARLKDDGFYVYKDDVYDPKVRIGVESDGGSPEITLGAGDGAGNNTFRITKNDYIAMIEHVSPSGKTSGFYFNDGMIIPLGDLVVDARFG